MRKIGGVHGYYRKPTEVGVGNITKIRRQYDGFQIEEGARVALSHRSYSSSSVAPVFFSGVGMSLVGAMFPGLGYVDGYENRTSRNRNRENARKAFGPPIYHSEESAHQSIDYIDSNRLACSRSRGWYSVDNVGVVCYIGADKHRVTAGSRPVPRTREGNGAPNGRKRLKKYRRLTSEKQESADAQSVV